MRLSQLEGVDGQKYKRDILPAILEQVRPPTPRVVMCDQKGGVSESIGLYFSSLLSDVLNALDLVWMEGCRCFSYFVLHGGCFWR